MILLSLNIRGVGGHLKVASFRRLLSHISPDIIFLQETLVDSKKARNFLINSFLTGIYVQLTLLAPLGVWQWLGILTPMISFLIFVVEEFYYLVLVDIQTKGINLLNLYGPCSDRQFFWEKIEARGLLDLDNLIIAGDFNLTTSVGETWGALLPKIHWQITSPHFSLHITWWTCARSFDSYLAQWACGAQTTSPRDWTVFYYLNIFYPRRKDSLLGKLTFSF
jgi:hypothetical protein